MFAWSVPDPHVSTVPTYATPSSCCMISRLRIGCARAKRPLSWPTRTLRNDSYHGKGSVWPTINRPHLASDMPLQIGRSGSYEDNLTAWGVAAHAGITEDACWKCIRMGELLCGPPSHDLFWALYNTHLPAQHITVLWNVLFPTAERSMLHRDAIPFLPCLPFRPIEWTLPK